MCVCVRACVCSKPMWDPAIECGDEAQEESVAGMAATKKTTRRKLAVRHMLLHCPDISDRGGQDELPAAASTASTTADAELQKDIDPLRLATSRGHVPGPRRRGSARQLGKSRATNAKVRVCLCRKRVHV